MADCHFSHAMTSCWRIFKQPVQCRESCGALKGVVARWSEFRMRQSGMGVWMLNQCTEQSTTSACPLVSSPDQCLLDNGPTGIAVHCVLPSARDIEVGSQMWRLLEGSNSERTKTSALEWQLSGNNDGTSAYHRCWTRMSNFTQAVRRRSLEPTAISSFVRLEDR